MQEQYLIERLRSNPTWYTLLDQQFHVGWLLFKQVLDLLPVKALQADGQSDVKRRLVDVIDQ